MTALVLVRLPVLVDSPYPSILRALVLAPFWVSITLNLIRIHHGRSAGLDGRMALLFACTICLTSAAYLRAVLDFRLPLLVTIYDWLAYMTVAIAAWLSFLAAPSPRRREQLCLAVLGGLTLYLLVNLALYAAGVRHAEPLYFKEFPASTLGLLGVRTSAALFPMAAGVNAFGAVGGAALAMSGGVLLAGMSGRWRVVLAIAGMILGLVTLLWTDARLSLLAAALVLGLMAAAGTRRALALRWMPLLPVVFPFLLVGGLALVPEAWWAAAGESARRFATLSNRDAIWRAVFEELLAFKPVHLVGFGAYGQMASGLSEAYSHFFTAWTRASLTGAHNAFLQTVIEIGYLGAGVALAAMVLALRLLAAAPGPDRGAGPSALLACLVFLAAAGATEATWSPQQQELQVILLLALAGASVMRAADGGGAPGLRPNGDESGRPPQEGKPARGARAQRLRIVGSRGFCAAGRRI